MVVALALSLLIAADGGQAAQQPPASAPDKKICRRQTDTGSIMTKRVCHTAGEWARIDGTNDRNADGFRNRPQTMPGRQDGGV